MLIIKEDDPRYNNLQYIYDNFDYDKVLGNKGFRNVWWLVPKELILKEVELNYPDVGHWVFALQISRFLRDYCKLTSQEYFTIVIQHNNDTDSYPRCSFEGCNNLIRFVNISQGYYKNSNYKDSIGKKFYCCLTHQRLAHEEANKRSINSLYPTICRERTYFVNLGKPYDQVFLYSAICKDGRFKYGVTSSLTSRLSTIRQVGVSYKSIHCILKSDRIKIGNIEALIKLKLNGYEYLQFEDKHKFFELVRYYFNNPDQIVNPFGN